MTALEQRIAETLTEHRISPDCDCTCGVAFYDPEDDALLPESFEASFEAHQAEMLAAVVAGAKAEAASEALLEAADEFAEATGYHGGWLRIRANRIANGVNPHISAWPKRKD